MKKPLFFIESVKCGWRKKTFYKRILIFHCLPPIVVLGREPGNFGRPEMNTALNLLQKINKLKCKNVIDIQCMNARSSLTLFHLLHINRITWKNKQCPPRK